MRPERQAIREGETMKFGMRTPSISTSIRARTTGRLKRSVKRAVIPYYGKRGSGWVKNPKRAAYNAVYRRTTFGLGDVLRRLFK
jgi:hypothetical protein